ncbi:MAG: hypothetical protein JWQ07_2695 [Ramlibacter sp.]|nr:hypothetical protein [Ramlibacter sp.]
MSFVTSSGQTISDQQIRDYFSRHPSNLEVAYQAAGLGLTADQIAGAISVGESVAVTPDAVRAWIAANAPTTYAWDPAGHLAPLSYLDLANPLSGNLDLSTLGGMQMLKLKGGAGTATVTGLHSGSTIESDLADTGKLTLSLANASGSNDMLTLKLDAAGSADFKTIDAPGVETLNIISTTTSATPAAVTNTLALSTTAHTTLNVTGNAALDLSPGWAIALMSVKTVSAASFNAGLHVYLYGNTNDLTINVGNGADIVVAGFGNDTITTGAGDDIIFAGRASDVVDAGPGNDWIRGGPARDVMTGGTGSDTFAYVFAYESSVDTGVDLINDFQAGAGGDILDFHDLTHGAGSFAGNANGYNAVLASLAHGAVKAVLDTSTSTLYLDVDASGTLDGTNDIAIQLAGISSGLAAANFIF